MNALTSLSPPVQAQLGAGNRPLPARLRARHRGLIAGFLALVAAPTLATGGYMYGVAQDQYASVAGFAVRSEHSLPALGLLAGLTGSASTTTADANILYAFIQSQDMATRVDSRMNLRALYFKPGDPLFTLQPDARIEEITRFWRRVVTVDLDHATGLLTLRITAFDAAMAQQLAQLVIEESSLRVNALADVARADATRHAKAELADATQRLSAARVALTRFRSDHQMVDPADDIRGQMGIVHTLQAEKAAAMVDLNLLRQTTKDSDPRMSSAQRRIAVIDQLIADERALFGRTDGLESYSTRMGEYERLQVEREFAERAYLAALTAYDVARAEAQRQSRYLATYVAPTRAETAEYPQRATLTASVFGFAMLLWSVAVLIYYSVRDRR